MSRQTPSFARLLMLGSVGVLVAALGIIVRFARSVVTPPRAKELNVRILEVDRAHRRVAFNVLPETTLPGEYGLWFGADAGYLRFGDIVSVEPDRVTCELLEVVSGAPRRGQIARETGWFWAAPWEAGLEVEHVAIATPLGAMPAWRVDAPKRTDNWTIHVHGRTAERGETLRGMKLAHEAGWNALSVSYRNDPGVPKSHDRRYGLGSTEWHDVLAAIEYLRDQGARKIVMFGWSTGAVISLRAALAARESLGLAVDGFVFDSPVISWPNIIEHHAQLSHLPRWMGDAVTALLASRAAPKLIGVERPINWRTVDGGNLVGQLALPVLLLHSADDGYVPVEPSRQLAADLPELVSYHEFAGAGHVRLWNADRRRWETTVSEWLAAQL
ncbi:MAG: alpha/beta hydrolase family protein [Microbacteriaceae bacterium]